MPRPWLPSHRKLADRSVGWDEGVLSTDGGMTLGEKSTLTITG